MKKQTFSRLIEKRWFEALTSLPYLVALSMPELTWKFGHHGHFASARGFACCYDFRGTSRIHILFAEKILKQPKHRIEGVLRHEIGHAFDMAINPGHLDAWASSRGVSLPGDEWGERRADYIAFAVWKNTICYDGFDVQTIRTRDATAPRPVRLGK